VVKMAGIIEKLKTFLAACVYAKLRRKKKNLNCNRKSLR